MTTDDQQPPTTDYTSPEYAAWYNALMQAKVDKMVQRALGTLSAPMNDQQRWRVVAYVATLLAQDAVCSPDEPFHVPGPYDEMSEPLAIIDYLYECVRALETTEPQP